MNTSCRVAILLCTHNGDKYLNDQLNSILNQKLNNWKIFASDDGSSDETSTILKKFQENYGRERIEIYDGPCRGPTKNFLFILNMVDKSYDYFAFCDQDDKWDVNKLTVAISVLGSLDDVVPSLYCGSSRYVTGEGRYLQNSYIFKNPPSFKNALVQSIAGGNTMVFNRQAAKLLSRTTMQNSLIAHDWWLYILITAHNGYVFYDEVPYLDYRQHSAALVGENRSFRSKAVRIKKLLDGRFQGWNDENLRVLNTFQLEICRENQLTLEYFQIIKSGTIYQRIFAFFKSGIRRQTFVGNIALFLAIIIRKI
jgi:glycosyltransferase involved in cell wall biosynthesis